MQSYSSNELSSLMKFSIRAETVKNPVKMDWLALENEIREIYRNKQLSEKEKLIEIDAVIGWHTGRGYEIAAVLDLSKA